ncbi:MAG: ribosome biogenesis GTPase Der [Gammaproteobacteria bacterium]|nr:ribosome biogenesis GTPase Der [Gammaproteobacteria bacterium]
MLTEIIIETQPFQELTPIIAIVGRPNVGKSTLFNCFTKSRAALVANQPGLTRDRQYGTGQHGEQPFIVIDTGGLEGVDEGVASLTATQAWNAVHEADAIIFLVDGKDGLTEDDKLIAEQLRPLGKNVYLVVNKTDGLNPDIALLEFYEPGLGEPYAIAALHRRGINILLEKILATITMPDAREMPESLNGDEVKIAFIGKPNVGKSTLVNRILGEERVVVYDQPGTTRDTIFVPFKRRNNDYILIDTAGIRRRGKVVETIEKFSIIKALQAIAAAHVVVLVIDAYEGITDQDLRLLGFILEAGRALVIAVNKWDGLEQYQREQIKKELDRRLVFVNFAEIHFISALHGTGVGHIFLSINRAAKSASKKLSTPQITRMLEQFVTAHEPPLIRGRRIKFNYAHAGGQNPPLIIIHGKRVAVVPASYRKYLINSFRKALKLVGTPIRIEFKSQS